MKDFVLQNFVSVVLGGLTVIFLLWFVLAFRRNRYRYRVGLLFILLVLFALIFTLGLDPNGSYGIKAAVLAFVVIFSFALLNTVFLFLISLPYNGIILLRKEGISFKNLLSLFLLIYMISIPFTIVNFDYIKGVPILIYLVELNGLYAMYLFVSTFIYVVSVILVLVTSQRKPVDYIIVLGCGLKNQCEVTPLLAGRIDCAIKLFNKDPEHTRLVMSGGKGNDEAVPEAQAMKEYAVEKGIPAEQILVEDRSRNTEENMRFSKELIEKQTDQPVKIAYATNRYHQFRAGMYAHEAGLNIRGVGSKTKMYFAENAAIREFIAMFEHDRVFHLFWLAILALLLLCIYLF